MVTEDSFITYKDMNTRNRVMISIATLIKDINIKTKPVDVSGKNFYIESFDGEKRVYNKLLYIKKVKANLYDIVTNKKEGLHTLEVGEGCIFYPSIKLESLRDKDIRCSNGICQITDVRNENIPCNCYQFKVENNNCYFVNGILIEGYNK